METKETEEATEITYDGRIMEDTLLEPPQSATPWIPSVAPTVELGPLPGVGKTLSRLQEDHDRYCRRIAAGGQFSTTGGQASRPTTAGVSRPTTAGGERTRSSTPLCGPESEYISTRASTPWGGRPDTPVQFRDQSPSAPSDDLTFELPRRPSAPRPFSSGRTSVQTAVQSGDRQLRAWVQADVHRVLDSFVGEFENRFADSARLLERLALNFDEEREADGRGRTVIQECVRELTNLSDTLKFMSTRGMRGEEVEKLRESAQEWTHEAKSLNTQVRREMRELREELANLGGLVRRVGKGMDETKDLMNASVLMGVVETQAKQGESLAQLRNDVSILAKEQRGAMAAFQERDSRLEVWEKMVDRVSALEDSSNKGQKALNELCDRAKRGEKVAEELPGAVNTLVEATVTTFNQRHQVQSEATLNSIGKQTQNHVDGSTARFETALEAVQELQANVAQQAGVVQTTCEETRHIAEDKWSHCEEQLQMLLDVPKEPEGPASGEPVIKLFRLLRDIERRGNVKIDTRGGDVEIKDLPWAPKKPPQPPTGEIANQKTADPILTDIFEIVESLAVPVTIEGHMKQGQGGTQGWWQELADNRMKYLADLIEVRGTVARSQIHPKGVPGKKGLNKAAILIKFDMAGVGFPVPHPHGTHHHDHAIHHANTSLV